MTAHTVKLLFYYSIFNYKGITLIRVFIPLFCFESGASKAEAHNTGTKLKYLKMPAKGNPGKKS